MPKKLRTIQLAAIVFLTVSGGPYGLEPLLAYAGAHAAFLLLLITPLLWDIPTIFVVLELNSMMPVTGGYYHWVKRALGIRWAFYEGWWTWLYTFVDLAIYPVLFIEYAAFFFPSIQAYRLPVCLAIIWLSAWLNIRGIMPVGKTSIVLSLLVLCPFIILFITVLWQYPFTIPHQTLQHSSLSTTGLAIYTIMWNFLGWDNTTTYAQEVKQPIRSYIISVSIAFLLILVIYTLAIFSVVKTGLTAAVLEREGFPAAGLVASGKWLAALLSAGGMASALGLYSGVLLSVSRIPEVMAIDHLLPQKLNKLHTSYGTPYVSIIVCSVAVSIMVFFSFESLIIIDVTLYGAALFLEYITLIHLRQKAPDDLRPFKIPFNITGLIIMMCLPLSVYCIAVTAAFISGGNSFMPLLFAICALFSAVLIWFLIKKNRKYQYQSTGKS